LKTYAEFNGSGEEVKTSGLGNFITARDTVQVDESRLNNALLALRSLNDGLGKSNTSQSPGISILSRIAYRKPAKAIDRVAEPAPSLALTTSSPPNWTPVNC
jgi:hypothetical protein